MSIPPFTPSVRVSAETAKNDLIQLEMGDWHIRGNESDVGDFFNFLGPYPNSHEALAQISAGQSAQLNEGMFGWMFNRPHGQNNFITKLPLRGTGRGSGTRPGIPIAKGELKIKHLSHTFDEARKLLRFNVSLNPTRFVRYQPCPPLVGEPVEGWNLSPARIRTPEINQANVSNNDEIVLDGNDNILRGARSQCFARGEAWPTHLRRYFMAFETAAELEFARAYGRTSLPLDYPQGVQRIAGDVRYNLDTVETYWEFAAENATRLVRIFEPILMKLGRNARSRSYPDGRAESSTEENATSVLIVLPGNRELRVYAKTNRRIRFEIIHRLKNPGICRLLNPDECRKTTSTVDELLSWFPILANDAAEKLNEVLAILEEELTPVELSAAPYELVAKIFSVVRSSERAETILTLLVENGCIRIPRVGSPLLPDIERLRRKGVLEHRLKADRVMPRYRQALQILQNQRDLMKTPQPRCRHRSRNHTQ